MFCFFSNYQTSNIDLTIYGKRSKYSASYAAGAMINILSEIDCFNVSHPLSEWKLANRQKGIQSWDALDIYLKEKKCIRL